MRKMLRRLQVPSGQIFDTNDLLLLKAMAEARSIEYLKEPREPVVMNSLVESRVYVRGREDVTDSPILLNMVGRKIAWTVKTMAHPDDHQPNLIGLPTAGTALAVAASTASVEISREVNNVSVFPIACRVMREKLKGSHGANNRWVNGVPELDRFTYWTVDNAATSGKTIIEQAMRLEEDGYPAKEMPHLIFIDREQGGVPLLQAAGFKRIVVCYLLLDIVYAYGELELWSPETVRAVEKEIAAHQFS